MTDPLQYSCQQNYAILSTDGFWNQGAGYKLDGSTAVGNQDAALPRPLYDGGSAQCKRGRATSRSGRSTSRRAAPAPSSSGRSASRRRRAPAPCSSVRSPPRRSRAPARCRPGPGPCRPGRRATAAIVGPRGQTRGRRARGTPAVTRGASASTTGAPGATRPPATRTSARHNRAPGPAMARIASTRRGRPMRIPRPAPPCRNPRGPTTPARRPSAIRWYERPLDEPTSCTASATIGCQYLGWTAIPTLRPAPTCHNRRGPPTPARRPGAIR